MSARNTITRRARARLVAVLFGLATAAMFAGPVSADGEPGTFEADCGSGTTIEGNQNTLTYTDPQNRDILGVCIKSGNMFIDGHSDSIDSDSTDPIAGCYQVQGVSGTGSTVTVTRVGDGPSCQGISHIDIVLGAAAGPNTPPSNPPSNPPAGPQGPAGPAGPAGPQGPAGPAGAAGAAGAAGTAGSAGGPARSGTLGSTGAGAGALPNTAVPMELVSTLGGLMLIASAVTYSVNRRRDS